MILDWGNDQSADALRELRLSGGETVEIKVTVRGPSGQRSASRTVEIDDAKKIDLQAWPLVEQAAKAYKRLP